MKCLVLSCLLFLGAIDGLLQAGSVVSLTGNIESTGKLALTPTSIHVEGGTSPGDIDLPDVLEARWGDVPFDLSFYSIGNSAGSPMPAAWKGQDIGAVITPGSVAISGNALTVSGGNSPEARPDHRADSLYFAGLPWTTNGQWTARVQEVDSAIPDFVAGVMMRDELAPNAALFSVGAALQGNGFIDFRPEAGGERQKNPVNLNLPAWLRLTRYGNSIFAATSSDGNEWDMIGEKDFKTLVNPMAGIFTAGKKESAQSKAIFDQVTLTPLPSSAEVLPPGVLLQSGSFFAGTFQELTFDSTTPDASGSFVRNGKVIPIPRTKIAAVLMLPTERKQLADMNSRVGLLMRNGDALDGDFSSIDRDRVMISSVVLGITTYDRTEVRACFLAPSQTQPSAYEIRLNDGSIIQASSVIGDGHEIDIGEVSGLTLTVSQDEIAQIRAGTSLVQNLAETDWKATPSASAAATPTAITPTPANPAPADNNATPANPAPVSPPAAQNWEGPGQEQIIEAATGTTVDFPLAGRFHALAVRIALTSDSLPNSNATIRVLADGKEIARTPAFKAGDQPRFMDVTFQSPKVVTLEADSVFAGTKVLFIDPVAIRNK